MHRGICIAITACTCTRVCVQHTHSIDVLKQFDDGRVQEVVSLSIGHKRLNDRGKQVVPHNVAIVVLIFQTDNSPAES